MNSRQKMLVNLLTAIVTFLLLYGVISIFIVNDYLNSLIPGWHTTLYNLSRNLRITILVSVSGIFAYILFKLIRQFLTFLWFKIAAKS